MAFVVTLALGAMATGCAEGAGIAKLEVPSLEANAAPAYESREWRDLSRARQVFATRSEDTDARPAALPSRRATAHGDLTIRR